MTKQYQNTIQDERLISLEEKFATINDELGDVKTDMAQVKADICWLKWWMKLTAGAAVSSLIVGLVSLLLK